MNVNTILSKSRALFLKPSDAIIYLLFQEEKVVYVGQTIKPFSRIGHHQGNKEFSDVRVIHVEESDLCSMEKCLISIFNPILNKSKPTVRDHDWEIFKKYDSGTFVRMEDFLLLPKIRESEYGPVLFLDLDEQVKLGLYDDDIMECDDDCKAMKIYLRFKKEKIDVNEDLFDDMFAKKCKCVPKAVIYDGGFMKGYKEIPLNNIRNPNNSEKMDTLLGDFDETISNEVFGFMNKK